jgi:RimJ/RimL family protein N-acetyltransferase
MKPQLQKMFKKATTEKQIAQIEAIAKEIWHEHYVPIIGLEQVTYMLNKFNSKAAISENIAIDGDIYFLIINDDEVIGYIGIKINTDELFLNKLYVHSKQRGQGIGKKAMKFLKQLALENNLQKVTLRVNIYNSNSIAAYEKFGFKTIAEDVADIGGGYVMDDYIMELELV